MRKLQQLRMGNTGYKMSPNILFWIRLKTLQSNNDINRILEIAYIYTDLQITSCQYGLNIVIHCSKEDFELASEKDLKFFKENGLYEACVNSKIGIQEAERMIMNEFEVRNIARGQLLTAGKQAHLAKHALMRHMPKLHEFLHYRILDLSSVKLVVQRFKDQQLHKQSKDHDDLSTILNGANRARKGVQQDIHQMQFYALHALNDN